MNSMRGAAVAGRIGAMHYTTRIFHSPRGAQPMPNQLQFQTSPYLLQHKDNPVDWRAWDAAALAEARDLDKPILLSVGYSACHWCHVMERECFENAAIAAQMNALFVCVKVDREERPDLDKIYQTAHQMLARRGGGWPLTVALTPTGLAPFFAGTYFPPAPRHGLPGFGEILHKVADYYRENHKKLAAHHKSFARAMAELNPRPGKTKLPDAGAAIAQATSNLTLDFDERHGGFGRAPKFPHPTQVELLLRHAAHNSADAKSAELAKYMLHKTLYCMARGGLFDHLGGGFFRYAVDRQWRIPHFEKMLYDNAQLLGLYADAYHCTGDEFYAQTAMRTAAWVRREMQLPGGGYASTLDADSEGVEGKYYVWAETELRALLSGEEYRAVESYYNLNGEPNFDGKWHFNISAEATTDRDPNLNSARQKLFAARESRIRPALDDKTLTAWNGLMLKGMARAARIFNNEEFIRSAQRAADFVRATMWRDGKLLVTQRNGAAHLNGYLDDYAFTAEGLLELLQTRWRDADLRFALQLCDALLARFEDPADGGFFFTAHDHEKLLHRPKTGADDAIPSGNAAAVRALCKFGFLTGEERYLQSAEKALQLFAADLDTSPSVYASLCIARAAAEPAHPMIIIRGGTENADLADAEMSAWLKICQRKYHPETIAFAIPAAADLPPPLAARAAMEKPVAYICRGHTCAPPIQSRAELERALPA